MAALNSAGRARRAAQGPTADDNSQSPSVSFATIGSYQPPPSAAPMSMPQQQQQQQQQLTPQQRQRQGFYQGLATFMSHRGSPLPPTVTGVQVPNFDPNNTMWKSIEPSSEIGGIKLCGKDVDLYRVFNMVLQAGGSNKVSKWSL